MKYARICTVTILLMLPILVAGASGPKITFNSEIHDFGPYLTVLPLRENLSSRILPKGSKGQRIVPTYRKKES